RLVSGHRACSFTIHLEAPGAGRREYCAHARPAFWLSWGKHHHHLTAFELRLGFDLGNRLDFLADAVQELHAKFHMRHLASAEAERKLDLVAFLEETAHGLHLHLIVMGVDVGTHLDLLDLDGLLLLAGLGSLLLALILHSAEIGDLADWRL